MVKIRLEGLPEEVEKHIEKLIKKGFKILQRSDPYKNRNSEYYRVYIEIE